MEWLATTDGGQDDTCSASALQCVRELPAKHSERVHKLNRAAADDRARLVEERILASFQACVADEQQETRLQRHTSYVMVWKALFSKLQALTSEANEELFATLMNFVSGSTVQPVMGIPAAYVFAGGFNSGDHQKTFCDLVGFLRTQGCHCALLTPRHLCSGGGGALGALLRQLSGAETSIATMTALLDWYRTTTARGQPAGSSQPPGSCPKTSAQRQAESVCHTPATAVPSRHTRQRPAASSPAGASMATPGAAAALLECDEPGATPVRDGSAAVHKQQEAVAGSHGDMECEGEAPATRQKTARGKAKTPAAAGGPLDAGDGAAPATLGRSSRSRGISSPALEDTSMAGASTPGMTGKTRHGKAVAKAGMECDITPAVSRHATRNNADKDTAAPCDVTPAAGACTTQTGRGKGAAATPSAAATPPGRSTRSRTPLPPLLPAAAATPQHSTARASGSGPVHADGEEGKENAAGCATGPLSAAKPAGLSTTPHVRRWDPLPAATTPGVSAAAAGVVAAAAGPGPAVAAPAPGGRAPLVVVVQEGEACDMAAVRDLVLQLSEERERLNVVLVIGMNTSAAAFHSALPVSAAARLCHRQMKLRPAVDRMESVWSGLLLGSSAPSIILGNRTAKLLYDHFMQLDFSTGTLCRGLQVAAMRHFQRCPLALLLPAISTGDAEAIEAACHELPTALLQVVEGWGAPAAAEAPAASRTRRPSEAELRGRLQRGLLAAVGAFGRWRLGVLCMASAASILGCGGPGSDYSVPRLYWAAADPSYMAPGGPGVKAVRHLCLESRSAVAKQLDDRCTQLLTAVQGQISPELQGMAADEQLQALFAELEQLLQPPGSAAAGSPVQGSPAAGGTPQPPAGDGVLSPLCRQMRGGLQVASPPGGAADGRSGTTPLQQQLAGVTLNSPGSTAAAMKLKAASSSRQGHRMYMAAMSAQPVATKKQAAAKKASAPAAPRLPAKAASLLQRLLQHLLGSCPFALPGSAAFCFDDEEALRGCLLASTSRTLATALALPGSYLPSAAPQIGPTSEDVCIAWRALEGRPQETAEVAEWFADFCEVTGIELPWEQATKRATKAPKKRGAKRPAGDEEEEDESEGEGPSTSAAADEAGVDEGALVHLAARFCQAAAELGHVGLIRPSKRARKESRTVQKMWTFQQ